MQLQIGQKSKFTDIGINQQFTVECVIDANMTIDISCFGLNEDRKLVDEAYMTFYNQPVSPKGEVKFNQQGNVTKFDINVSNLPTTANKLLITAAIDTSSNPTSVMSQLNSLEFKAGSAQFNLTGKDFNKEKAIIIAELYQKDGVWRLAAVGQGFNGGLDALILSFGGQVAEAAPTPAAPLVNLAETKKKVFLEKRISLEKQIASSSSVLLDLTKKAGISLEKKGLGQHQAKVALCLDISASMDDLYFIGVVQRLVERVLALGCRLDDDGSIDIFLFGANGYQPEPITYKDFNGYVARIIKQHPLEGDTKYATAMELVRRHYTDYKYERSEPLMMEVPVYVMFVTDGRPSDKAQATKVLKNSAYEPIFWQFMGVGTADLSYLEKLDDLDGRYIDNADFFRIADLSKVSDEQLFEKMVNEYPKWVELAKAKKLLRA